MRSGCFECRQVEIRIRRSNSFNIRVRLISSKPTLSLKNILSNSKTTKLPLWRDNSVKFTKDKIKMLINKYFSLSLLLLLSSRLLNRKMTQSKIFNSNLLRHKAKIASKNLKKIQKSIICSIRFRSFKIRMIDLQDKTLIKRILSML